jgi:hypothetical protein
VIKLSEEQYQEELKKFQAAIEAHNAAAASDEANTAFIHAAKRFGEVVKLRQRGADDD